MLPIVITSLLLARTRSMLEIIPQRWREEWEHYLELRVLVLLSLTFQITLVALGGRRKTIRQPWIRMVVWCAYLSADTVAIYSLGVIKIEPTLKCRNGGPGSCNNANAIGIDPTTELRAFWAPFLLMHLGGPDAITAYALEDNKLWIRHCLTLVNQAVLTLYILFLSWSGSYISWLYVVIFVCGLIKYSERVWALWAASSETFRGKTPERHKRIPRMLEEQILKGAEGHDEVAHLVTEKHQVLGDYDINWRLKEEALFHWEISERRQKELLVASGLADIFRPAFTDHLLSFDDADSGRSTLKRKNYKSVFNIIAIELGFIFDLLFTKAILFQTPWGVATRAVTLSLTTITFGVFITFTSASLYRKKEASHQYINKVDLCITLVFVVAAVFLELYALLQHLFSDRVICWLIKQNHSTTLEIINGLRPLSNRQRWSGKIGQFSLVSYSLKEKHYLGHHEIRGTQRYFYLSHKNVEDVLKDRLYDHIKKIAIPMYTDLQSLWAVKWKDYSQRKKQLDSLEWSISKELEFDMCILIWHVATGICYHTNLESFGDEGDPEAEVSLVLSRYMLHLLVMYPALLPAGIGRIEFKDMHSMMSTFFKHHRSASAGQQEAGNHRTYAKNDSKKKLSIEDACNLLLNQVNTQLNLTVSSVDTSKFVMFYGCRLASQLIREIEDAEFRFALLRETWIGLLILAALKCKTSSHLQHLRRGGELLTHVWLLLVHFGLTDHFKIPKTIEIAELIIK